jgi:hypothetical protein
MRKLLFLLNFFIIFNSYGQSLVSKFDVASNGANSVTFVDKSIGVPRSYQWEFQGGVPAVSTEKNPKVSYSLPGKYSVKLKVTDAKGITSTSVRTLEVSYTVAKEIDLSTGTKEDGTLMSENGEKDADWTHYLDEKLTIGTVPHTRKPYLNKTNNPVFGNWESAELNKKTSVTRWITTNSRGKDNRCYYVSKTFKVPTEGVLNLKALAFTRNWVYLVKKNPNGTEDSKQITRTKFIQIGTSGLTKGWLNPENPEVVDYKLEQGEYYIKVEVSTSSSLDKQSIDVNAKVGLGVGIKAVLSPPADFKANATTVNFGANVQFSNISAGAPVSQSWTFTDAGNHVTDKQKNPLIKFKSVGYHNVELLVDYGNQIVSSLSIDNYMKVAGLDYTKAPNSYIFDHKSSNSGLFIPVKKAYEMWKNGPHIEGGAVPNGQAVAEVYWEDVHGLIRTKPNYQLEIIGSGESAKIKVPVNKAKEGNALVVYKVNGKIYWSWHVWVTDDPSKGTNYMAYDETKRLRNNGVEELIPKAEWGWMDRNLGAVSSSLTEEGWNRNNGLLYQWGRKDPIPPLATRGWDFYEVSGSIGRIGNVNSHNNNVTKSLERDMVMYVPLAKAKLKDNIKLSIHNPMNIIYVNADNSDKQAYYNGNVDLPVNWFGITSSNDGGDVAEVNLWSDNSKGKFFNPTISPKKAVKPYHDKSSYDPCPNGWRVPSVLTANRTLGEGFVYSTNIPMEFSPYGPKTKEHNNNNLYTIKPTNDGMPDFLKGIKMYSEIGADLSSVNGQNMGVFPGTGMLSRFEHGGEYSDMHETYLWTATMVRWWDKSQAVHPMALRIIPDPAQLNDRPDPKMPSVIGRYAYNPLYWERTSSDAMGVRCIKDPLYVVNEYDFPTEYFRDEVAYPTFTDGLENPNTYQIVKKTTESIIKIPINKAFSVHSEHLDNKQILKNTNYNNLKVNVHWTTNKELIKHVSISKTNPASLTEINNTFINVKIASNQSGNAVVTLHNGSIANPVYWSWHIWVTDSEIETVRYVTAEPNTAAYNYINYVAKDHVIDSEFMDRNLGALDAFPSVVNTKSPSVQELNKIKVSGGMQYQWGRKDPIPSFINPDGSSYSIYLGNTNATGQVSYTELNSGNYESKFVVPYNSYANNVVSTDKISDKVSKVLSYSVKNPLVFMIPSKLVPRHKAYTNGMDWLIDEANIASDRWGRADRKSPFDPCPEGWRVPDASHVDISTGRDFGRSPWGKRNWTEWKGLQAWYSIQKYFKGEPIITPKNQFLGYVFEDAGYHIGNYPFTGARGYRMTFDKPITFKIDKRHMGVWTSAMGDALLGRPRALVIDKDNGAMSMFEDHLDPYFAMNCRCVKIKTTADGKQEGAIPRLPIPKYTVAKPAKPLAVNTVQNMLKEEKTLKAYPNPVTDILMIDGESGKEYFYQLYDKNGKMLKEGKFVNNQINISNLLPDIYLIRINNSKEAIKIIKK